MTQPVGTVLNPGDEIGFRLESDEDAYVIVFNIDTEGYVNLLYPAKGERPVHVRSGNTYMIPDDSNELLIVEGQTGVEFVFALVVPERDDIDRRELDFLGKSNNLPPEERYRIDGDPFIAANIIAGELIRGISHRDGVYLDYAYFFINEWVSHPCYLCGECDGGQPDMDCADFIITANFDENRPLSYPMRRAYEMIEPAATPALEDVNVSQATGDDRTFGQYESDDGTVNINFYPYNSEVYYETRESLTGAQDVDVYLYGAEPGWQDPWNYGWYYYPSTRVSFYWGWPAWGWGFGWGYWGGYYCSSWYWPRCYRVYDSWCYDYCYYDGGYRYRPERYKDRYDSGGGGGGRTGYKEKYATTSTAYQSAYAQAAKRDSKMKLASGNVRTSTKSGVARTAVASRAKTDRGAYKSLSKTTRVRNFGTRYRQHQPQTAHPAFVDQVQHPVEPVAHGQVADVIEVDLQTKRPAGDAEIAIDGQEGLQPFDTEIIVGQVDLQTLAKQVLPAERTLVVGEVVAVSSASIVGQEFGIQELGRQVAVGRQEPEIN
jgi:hypothetical protein